MMKNKALTISAFALIGLLLVAILLYKKLSPSYAPEQLSTIGTTATAEAPDTTANTSDTAQTTEAAPETTQATESTTPSTTEIPLAPDFTVYDIDGKAYKLSDFRGKPVVLNFWASWCGPCKMEMPDFNTSYGQLGEEIHFLMVNMTDGSQETRESASSFIAGTGYTFPVYYDTDYEAAIAYSVYSLPTTYFIDAEGYAVAQATGAIDAETLQRGIDMIYTP